MNEVKNVKKLSVGQRFQAAFKGFQAAISGQWEGGRTSRYRDRPTAQLTTKDATLDFGDRERLMAEARNLSQTFPIVRRILRQYSTYCIGGLRSQWRTGDPDIDRQYEAAWLSSMDTLDTKSQHHFTQLAGITLQRELCDGDIFAQKVNARNNIAQLALIEGDRVGNMNAGGFNMDSDNIIGGVGIDAVGRPNFYRVSQRTRFGTLKDPRDVSTTNMLHVWDTDRADSYRGVSSFATVLNAMRDLKEIIHAETVGVKVNSKLALIVKSMTGGIGTSNGEVELFSNTSTTQSASDQVNAQEVNDGVMQYMFPGEDMKAHTSDRPSAAWQGFVDWLVSLIAIGLDLPKSVVWSMAGLGGPAARFEIQSARRTFTAKQDIFERQFLVPVCAWTTSKLIKSGRLPFHPNWHNFRFQRPPFVSIDLGRDSKAGIEENKSGLLTASEWYQESGKDFFEETEQLAVEAKFRKEMAEKHGVNVESIRQSTPNGNPVGGEEPQPQPAQPE